jgi:hypothetical protein
MRSADLLSEPPEELFPVSAIARGRAGRGGRPMSPSTPWRWAVNGVRLRSGRVVRLAAVRIGAGYYTSAEAVEEFLRELQPTFVRRGVARARR